MDRTRAEKLGLRVTILATSGRSSYATSLPEGKPAGTDPLVRDSKELSDPAAHRGAFLEPLALAVLIEGRIP